MDNDEVTGVLDLAVGGKLWLEETFLLPPAVPSRLNSDWIVCLEVRVFKRSNALLLADRGILDIFGQRFLLRLLLLCLLLLGRIGSNLSSLRLFSLELGGLFGLLSFLFHYMIVSDYRIPGEEKTGWRTQKTHTPSPTSLWELQEPQRPLELRRHQRRGHGNQ